MMDESVHPVARLSWRAILAGAIASLSITWLLLSLGSAVGLTAMEPTRGVFASPAAAAGMGIWFVVAVAIGSFLGAMISVRASSIVDRVDALIQGFTTWALGFLFSAVLAAFLTAVTGSGMLAGLGEAVGAEAPRARAGAPAARTGAAQERAAAGAEAAVDTGAGASWIVFASGLAGALAGLAGGVSGLRRTPGPHETRGRGVTLGQPVEGGVT